ncbi:hypothetical protein M885DRAFT_543606 [Pelagophyceae sp. CCMP2097]|nr:hypothetical protein M885DRAFT_543606 [Pelagophyceae sp. CCMP2097]
MLAKTARNAYRALYRPPAHTARTWACWAVRSAPVGGRRGAGHMPGRRCWRS